MPLVQRSATLVCVVVLTAICCGSAAACPSCKVALANQGGGSGDLVQGFFWSILFMLSMPFAIVAGMGSYFYWLVRKARVGPSGATAKMPTAVAASRTDAARPRDLEPAEPVEV